jgi:DNA-binding GntR family transcriptional regulator
MKTSATLTDQLRRAIESEIVSGQLIPGARLEVGTLARRYNVSRTPVREAIIQLSSLGYVEMRPHHEVRVARLSVQGMLDVFEVLADLESFASELAARRMTDGERLNMQDLHTRCQAHIESGTPGQYYEANIAFHEAIHRASRNPYLVQSIRAVRIRVAQYRRVRVQARARREQSWSEHEAVVDAIVRGDSDAARQSMRRHIAMQGDGLQDFLSALPAHYFS